MHQHHQAGAYLDAKLLPMLWEHLSLCSIVIAAPDLRAPVDPQASGCMATL